MTAVHTAQELVDAMAGSARDIEIRAQLDLRTMPLKGIPGNADKVAGYNVKDAGYEETDVAFIRWPTRTIRVRAC